MQVGDKVYFIDWKFIPNVINGIVVEKVHQNPYNYEDSFYNIQANNKIYKSIPEKYMFYDFNDASKYITMWLDTDKTPIKLSFLPKDGDELLETLWLCRSLINKHIYEEDSNYGEKHLKRLDLLIDSLDKILKL